MFGGPDGELAASLRYLNQRYVMPYAEVKGLLTDIGVSISKLRTTKHNYFMDFPYTYPLNNSMPRQRRANGLYRPNERVQSAVTT